LFSNSVIAKLFSRQGQQMPTLEDILAVVTAPLFAPLFVVVLAIVFVFVARARKQARDHLRRANEIESRLHD
jgi:heme/copper-type cytochrome/quinol oxidase subunit 2